MTTTFLVRRDRLADTQVLQADDPPLAPGQARVRIDRFALTANNVTYAAFGEAMQYWQFYPSGQAGWGVVPVWGFASVVQSLHPGVAVGERLYGYWPMASASVVQPVNLSPHGFAEGAEHRASLHPVYNQLLRVNADAFYSADSEDVQCLLRPLFGTSWLIDDFLGDNDFFGARRVVLSSASSKTAYGTAWLLRPRPDVELVGFTSAANRAFCEALGCYHRVLGYDELTQLETDVPAVYVDFSGNAEFRRRLHHHLAQLRYSCAVGGTHVEQLGGAKGLPGPPATLFFAPAQSKKRAEEWGGAELGRRMADAWHAFRHHVEKPDAPWLRVQRGDGAPAVQQAYADLLAGRSDPAQGHVLSLA